MFLLNSLKGSLQASFFIVALSFSHLCQSQDSTLDLGITDRQVKALADTSIWQALLHWNGVVSIDDKQFLLSQPNFSPENELHATLEYLYSKGSNPQCRFPARYLFLQHALALPSLDLNACHELVEFQQKAPVDQLFLIFSSENISQPSSMMGHVLIKISGINASNVHVDHAISFYTEISGINLPKIMYTNLIAGGQGYFTLSPYQEKLRRYNRIENRNVWEYEIESDELSRKLIQFHLFELKQIQLRYFFKGYNCATLTQFVLALASDENVNKQVFGVTPIDVVKQIKNTDMIKSSSLTSATKWRIRMLEDSISKGEKRAITAAVQGNDMKKIVAIKNDRDRFLAFQLAESYTEFQLQEDMISAQQNNSLQEKITEAKNHNQDFDIDLRDYKDPTKSPADSQATVGAFKYLNEEYLTLGIMPASHKLEDDNSQYFGETELALGELQLASSLEDGSAFMNSFSLYSVKSLIPRDAFSGGISGRFKIGMEHQPGRDWNKHSAYYIEGALGSTLAIGDDISIYGLIGAGVTASKTDTYVSGSPELGMIVKEIFDMKSILHARRTWAGSSNLPTIDNLSFTQAFYLNSDWAAFVAAERITIGPRSEDQYSFWLKNYF